MKGNSLLFGTKNERNGRWIVDKIYEFKNHNHPHKLPDKSTPNSTITQVDDNGKVVKIRHYDENGNA